MTRLRIPTFCVSLLAIGLCMGSALADSGETTNSNLARLQAEADQKMIKIGHPGIHVTFVREKICNGEPGCVEEKQYAFGDRDMDKWNQVKGMQYFINQHLPGLLTNIRSELLKRGSGIALETLFTEIQIRPLHPGFLLADNVGYIPAKKKLIFVLSPNSFWSSGRCYMGYRIRDIDVAAQIVNSWVTGKRFP